MVESCDGLTTLQKRIMRILVCVKQIIDPDGIRLKSDSAGAAPRFAGEKRMNRYDAFALESALRIKDKFPDTQICAVTLGPKTCAQVLIRAMGMGAGSGVLLATDDFEEPEEVGPAADFIAAYLMNHPYDLVLTGAMSEDRMRGETGPRIAALADLPYVGSVVDLEFEQNKLRAKREIEGGVREHFELELPAVVAVQSHEREPRYPALSRLMRAKKRGVEIIEAADPDGQKAKPRRANFIAPLRQRSTEFLQGDAREKAKRLTEILRRRGVLQ